MKKEILKDGTDHISAQTFAFPELAVATKNFRNDCLLGEGGFGRVYKGRLESTNQVGLNLLCFLECTYFCYTHLIRWLASPSYLKIRNLKKLEFMNIQK